MDRLYTITRSDLPAGAGDPRISQTGHAVAAFAAAHPVAFKAWSEPEQRNIICLEVTSREQLEHALARLRVSGARVAEFRESDVGNELTSIACGEEGAKLLSSLPLAGRAPRVAA